MVAATRFIVLSPPNKHLGPARVPNEIQGSTCFASTFLDPAERQEDNMTESILPSTWENTRGDAVCYNVVQSKFNYVNIFSTLAKIFAIMRNFQPKKVIFAAM